MPRNMTRLQRVSDEEYQVFVDGQLFGSLYVAYNVGKKRWEFESHRKGVGNRVFESLADARAYFEFFIV